MRRGQATILLLAVLLPASLLGLVGLAYLGARVQGERAQRLADTAALRAAQGLPVAAVPDAEVQILAHGDQVRASVRLRRTTLDGLGLTGIEFTARAAAVARAITTGDGTSGAVLVG